MSALGEAIIANLTNSMSAEKQTEAKALNAAIDTMVTDAETKRSDAILAIQQKLWALEAKAAEGVLVRQSTIDALEKILTRLSD